MAFDKNEFYARTMHTPDSPERAVLRTALRELSRALLPLHRRLIDVTREDYEFAVGPAGTPSQLVELLQSDPFFAWLRPFTALIVEIDEMVRTDFAPADAARIAVRVEEILGEEHYLAMLQRDTDVAIGHAALRKALTALRRR